MLGGKKRNCQLGEYRRSKSVQNLERNLPNQKMKKESQGDWVHPLEAGGSGMRGKWWGGGKGLNFLKMLARNGGTQGGTKGPSGKNLTKGGVGSKQRERPCSKNEKVALRGGRGAGGGHFGTQEIDQMEKGGENEKGKLKPTLDLANRMKRGWEFGKKKN